MNGSRERLRAEILATKIRRDVVEMIGCEGQTGHLGGSFSSADLVAALYGAKMRFDPRNPDWEERDRFIYSKGHAAIAQYAAMAEAGYFPREELKTVKCLGSRLQGHPDRLKLPGVEAGTGSLGQGLSVAVGMALGMRLDGRQGRVYCVIGDGEMNEGQIWEAAMAASNFGLDHLVAILDLNGQQATGRCEDRFRLGGVREKWEAFGWETTEIDGHDMAQIFQALDSVRTCAAKPHIIIAHTMKGYGVSFAQDRLGFHNCSLTPQQYQQALSELDAHLDALGQQERMCEA